MCTLRPRLRYSIRGLGVLTAIIAVGLGWYVAYVRPQAQAVAAILEAGGRVHYADVKINPVAPLPPDHSFWRRSFGEVRIVSLEGSGSVCGGEICSHLGKLKSLGHAELESLGIADSDLAELEGLKRLSRLSLNGNPITDAGLRHLWGLSRLRTLDLGGTRVTEAGVKKLQSALPGCTIYWAEH